MSRDTHAPKSQSYLSIESVENYGVSGVFSCLKNMNCRVLEWGLDFELVFMSQWYQQYRSFQWNDTKEKLDNFKNFQGLRHDLRWTFYF